MPSGPLQRQTRIRELERLIFDGASRATIARTLGVTPQCVSRYLQQRRRTIAEDLASQTCIVRQTLLSDAKRDLARLDAIIADLETSDDKASGTIVQALAARNNIRKAVSR